MIERIINNFILAFVISIPSIAISGETISSPFLNSKIQIKTCDHDAGAICSLTWNNKEFLNDYDHGRQLQSAASFDYQGENFNPTEAGASMYVDGLNPNPSSSKLLYSLASNNALTTQTQMAFWNPVNGKRLSNHIFEKRVKIGLPDLPNVIEYRTEFTIPSDESHSFGQFEVLTGYMPPSFSKFMTYDPSTNFLSNLSDNAGEQNKPIIFSTPDWQYAMAIYSPDSPQPAYKSAGYGRWRHPDCVKWNNVFRFNNPAGTYRFTSYVIVGKLTDVVNSMNALYSKFKR